MSSGQSLHTHESTLAGTTCTRFIQDHTRQWSSMGTKGEHDIQPFNEWQSASSLFLFSEMKPMIKLPILHWLALQPWLYRSTNWNDWVIKKGKINEAGKRTVEGPRKSWRRSRNWKLSQIMICVHMWNYQRIIFKKLRIFP